MFSLYIITFCLIYNIALAKSLQIFSTVFVSIFRPSEVIVSAIFFDDNGFPILSNTNLKTLLSIIVSVIFFLVYNILYNNRIIDSLQIISDLIWLIFLISSVNGNELFCKYSAYLYSSVIHTASTLHIFLKRQRQHFNLNISS